MKKVFLWLIIVSTIAVFSLVGCKAEAAEEVVEGETVEETTETTTIITETTQQTTETEILPPKPIFTSRIDVGATAYDWFSQKTWGAMWDKIEPISYLANHGFNFLRVGVTTVSTPELEDNYSMTTWRDKFWCSREYALQVLKAGANAGMGLYLFFYLSDKAAYGSNQKAPAIWQSYSLEETAAALKKYTYETTKYYMDKGLKIKLYEIGNEIEFGVCGYSNDTKLSLSGVNYLTDIQAVRKGIWEKEAFLLKSAIEGVRQADPEGKIVLHISTTQYPKLTEAFFKAMNDFGVSYDFAGLSYYPWLKWHTEVSSLSNCLELSVDAISKLGKDVIISEVSFPSDKTPLIPSQEVPGYPFNLEGQAKWISDFLKIAENNPKIKSVFYFYPDNYIVEDCGAASLFSDDKHPKLAIYEFQKFQSANADTTPPVIKSLSVEPSIAKNGDALKVTADCGEIGLDVTLNMMDLDSTKTTSEVLTHVANGIYKGEIQISLANDKTNGIKTVKVEATDSSGNKKTETSNIELKNSANIISANPFNDNFDGNILNTSKWKPDTSSGGVITQDNRLILSTSNKQAFSSAKVESVWEFTRDFDAQVDFEMGEGWRQPSSEHLDGAALGVQINGQIYHITRLISAGGTNQLFAWSSEGNLSGQLSTDALSGKYRLVRIGTTLTLLYDIGNGWQELAKCNVTSDPAKIYLENGSINASHAFTTYFDNFHINSGFTTYRS